MDYSKLSDIEINGRVLHAITNGKAIRLQQASVASGETDYCNNPADAWPIIINKMLCIDQFGHGSAVRLWGYSSRGLHEVYVRHKDILRGFMMVYLMMQDGD